jgi:hypothetical protein
LLEPNSDPEENYKITAVFEGKTLVFENCKPKKSDIQEQDKTVVDGIS